MIAEKNAPRLLGTAFLFVFFASLISGVLLARENDLKYQRLSVRMGLTTVT